MTFRGVALILCLGVALLTPSMNAGAAPAAPITVTLTQDDGSTFQARPKGDEYRSWMETLEGYTVVRQSGAWYYAQRDANGQLEASSYKVGAATKTLTDIPKHLSPPLDPSQLEIHVPRSLATPGTKSLIHTQNIVVILVDYNNVSFTYTDASFQSLLFGATGSVKEYYLECTYNNFTITPAAESYGTSNDGVIHISRGINHPNMGKSFAAAKAEAAAVVAAADGNIDYSAFDTSGDGVVTSDELSIVIILAGYENAYGGASALTPNVWGHKSSTASAVTLDGVDLQPYTMFGEAHATSLANKHQGTIGIMCHELGHLMLGFPDLYNVDESSEGIGDWGLMAGGNWNSTGMWSGETPAHLCAWSKAAVDITTPTVITSASAGVTIANGDSNADIKRLWIDKYKVRESFLIENRQLSNYDAGLPGSGLLIYHIDDSKTTNADETHKLCDVEAADGNTDMDDLTNRGDTGDPFPGSSSNTAFHDSSTPNSKDYSGAASNAAVTNISASMATMTADFTPATVEGTGDHVRYDERGYTGKGVTYSLTTIWTALEVTNSTSMVTLDGIEAYTSLAATVDVYVYQSMSGTMPTTLLHSEVGFAASAGWNRLLLASPQPFPVAATRVIVLKMTAASSIGARYDNLGPVSNRSYIDSDGIGSFLQLNTASGYPGDLNQAILLSSTPVPVEVSGFTVD